MDNLLYKPQKAHDIFTEEQHKAATHYAARYAAFINKAKTERRAVNESIKRANAAGFAPYKFGDKLQIGGKYYYNNRGKALYLFTVGTENPENGARITAAHNDVPRIDLKPRPLYEEDGIGYFKTQYYGGIKKYQWMALPLALHGVIVKANGESVDVCIGEDESDPVFYMTDLLPHLGANQSQKTLGSAFPAESLNVIVGTLPDADAGEDKVKTAIMKLLNEKYGIIEADFISAELSLVPAQKARDIGLDRSLLGGYGHDDLVCTYPILTALLDCQDNIKTKIAVLSDKEETGSNGNTGMQCSALLDIMAEIAAVHGANLSAMKAASKALSADVNAAYDPVYADVYDKRNSCFLHGGVVLTKYTGSGGKGGTSDASAEFMGYVRNLFDKAGILWQTGTLGKVDQGGGGTVAKFIAELNIDTVDIGVPVLSMHAPFECIAKTDLYMTYLALSAFMV